MCHRSASGWDWRANTRQFRGLLARQYGSDYPVGQISARTFRKTTEGRPRTESPGRTATNGGYRTPAQDRKATNESRGRTATNRGYRTPAQDWKAPTGTPRPARPDRQPTAWKTVADSEPVPDTAADTGVVHADAEFDNSEEPAAEFHAKGIDLEIRSHGEIATAHREDSSGFE